MSNWPWWSSSECSLLAPSPMSSWCRSSGVTRPSQMRRKR
jgi:hypothetical protein